MKSNFDFTFIKKIDLYGKQPEFYLKGNPKKVTWIGTILTIIYIIIYIVYFCYKLYRMINRVDFSFFDSYSETGEPPSIHVTNENFYIIFTMIDRVTGEPFIDETIYYAVANFKDNEEENIEVEPCNINKIGSKYKNLFEDYNLNKYYCLSKVNYTLIAYMNSFNIKIYPCKNTTENNNHCQSKEIIDKFLNGNDFVIKFEDILITPNNFNYPVKPRINELFTTIFKFFGQFLYIEMQLVDIETNKNIIGFDFLTKPEIQNHIKLDTLEIIPQPGYDLDNENNHYSACEIEIQLKDKILNEQRQYTQFFDVLGEVGGFMEAISSFFTLICSFIVDILYEQTIANNLFSFDLSKKIIIIKNKGNNSQVKNNENKAKQNGNIYELENLTSPSDINRNKNKYIIDDFTNRKINEKNNDNLTYNKKNKRNILDTNSYKNEKEYENYEKQSFKNNSKSNDSINFEKRTMDKLINDKENNNIINYIKLNNLLVHLGFFCVRKRKNVYNVLLNEVNNLIVDKLDILYIFKNMHLNEKNYGSIGCGNEIIKMSHECIKTLDKIIIK